MKSGFKYSMLAISALMVSAMGSDAHAQNGGYATSPQAVYSAPVMPATPQTFTATSAAPIAVGSGCVSGNCGGNVVMASPVTTPVTSYSYPNSYPTNTTYPTNTVHQSYAPAYQATSHAMPVTTAPVSSWQGARYQMHSAPTCSGGNCSNKRVFRNRR
ncbi:hypothetical protein SAMN06265222_106287 [Neorhodopirellula lusitana]|uniref:Uncharacterized protein n=2 Tax=Neorhodopirellula lusitana TaxID=445327 RepID=A0ABY1Q516_9BACT|nr:hypothetical protein SAMN06265222_106287 [Neorhodopirellula lusitana]